MLIMLFVIYGRYAIGNYWKKKRMNKWIIPNKIINIHICLNTMCCMWFLYKQLFLMFILESLQPKLIKRNNNVHILKKKTL